MLHPPTLATVHPLHAYLVPLCFFAAWVALPLFLAKVWVLSSDTLIYAQRMYQIPCSTCCFFTKNYQLKCTIHPIEALTEEAINCLDYESKFTLSSIDKPTLEHSKIEQVISKI